VCSSDLLEPGWHWLQGREERAEWAHVWQDLLARHEHAPVTLEQLLEPGWRWLQGREERAEWNYVWQALRQHPVASTVGTGTIPLDDLAWTWLLAHRDAQAWQVIWWDLAHSPTLSAERRAALLALGADWLGGEGRLASPEASRFVEGLLDMGCTQPRFLTLAAAWLQSAQADLPWPITAAKFIVAAPHDPVVAEVTSELVRRIHACPNNSFWHKIGPVLGRLSDLGGTMPPAIVALQRALAERAAAPVWARAQELRQGGTPVQATVRRVKPDFYSLELDIGLMALLPSQGGKQLQVGDAVSVVVVKITPGKGFVGVRRHLSDGQDSAPTLSQGHEIGRASCRERVS
jgi:hypothetical protein